MVAATGRARAAGPLDLRGKAVLVTGGTMGIGLATGLAFAKAGADVTLTYKWGSVEADDVKARFRHEDAREPDVVEADVTVPEHTTALFERIKARGHQRLHAFVSNVSLAAVIRGLDDYNERALYRSIAASAWPMIAYTKESRRLFGNVPRHIVGLSSGGPDHFYKDYDFVAATKAVLETFCRYLSYRLFDEDCRINVVRSRMVKTESFKATFGPEFEAFLVRLNMTKQFISCEQVAGTIFALCSGMFDAMSGQVLMVDRGATFFDNLMRLYEERDWLDLEPKKETVR